MQMLVKNFQGQVSSNYLFNGNQDETNLVTKFLKVSFKDKKFYNGSDITHVMTKKILLRNSLGKHIFGHFLAATYFNLCHHFTNLSSLHAL